MSVLVFAESSEGKYKKGALEAVSYGSALAKEMQTNLVTLTAFAEDTSELSKYASVWADFIAQAAKQENAEVVILGSSANDVYVAPLVAVKLEAGYASNTVGLPTDLSSFTVKRKAFSNKAFQFTSINSSIKVVGIAKNSFGLKENEMQGTMSDFTPNLEGEKVTLNSVEKTSGKVTIADADIVVSGGRGLKSGDNWGIIEELAEVLGAATACSKPVSDLDWRPHSEHVGQTGKQVASNLYIAIGISGAIQHLAGVNASKVKVVINTDADAPFFKAADYGIVGDAFDVVPKLVENLKAFKAQN